MVLADQTGWDVCGWDKRGVEVEAGIQRRGHWRAGTAAGVGKRAAGAEVRNRRTRLLARLRWTGASQSGRAAQ